jgi:hypothetical protein
LSRPGVEAEAVRAGAYVPRASCRRQRHDDRLAGEGVPRP